MIDGCLNAQPSTHPGQHLTMKHLSIAWRTPLPPPQAAHEEQNTPCPIHHLAKHLIMRPKPHISLPIRVIRRQRKKQKAQDLSSQVADLNREVDALTSQLQGLKAVEGEARSLRQDKVRCAGWRAPHEPGPQPR